MDNIDFKPKCLLTLCRDNWILLDVHYSALNHERLQQSEEITASALISKFYKNVWPCDQPAVEWAGFLISHYYIRQYAISVICVCVCVSPSPLQSCASAKAANVWVLFALLSVSPPPPNGFATEREHDLKSRRNEE